MSPGNTFAQGFIGAGNALAQYFDPKYRLQLDQLKQQIEADELAKKELERTAAMRDEADKAFSTYRDRMSQRDQMGQVANTLNLDFGQAQSMPQIGKPIMGPMPAGDDQASMTPYRPGASSPVNLGPNPMDQKPMDLYQQSGLSAYRDVDPRAAGIGKTLEFQAKSENPNNALGLGGWAQRSKDWDAISQLPEGPEKEQAKVEYLYKWAPSAGFNASPEGVEQAGRRSAASTAGRLGTQAVMADTTAEAESKIARATSGARIEGEFGAKEKTPGAFSQSQYAAGNYGNRLEQAERNISELEASGFNPSTMYNQVAKLDALELIKNPQQKQYAQAMRNFINANMRRESGAAIAQSEFDSATKQYFASVNDDPATLAQKRQNRQAALSALKAEAGGAYNQIVDQFQRDTQSSPAQPRQSGVPESVIQQARDALSDPDAPEQVKAKARRILQKAGGM